MVFSWMIFFWGWIQGSPFFWHLSCPLQSLRPAVARGQRWLCTRKQSWRNGHHIWMQMGWWNASPSTQMQSVRGMSEHTRFTEQTQFGVCWWEGGGGSLSARVSVMLSHPPFTFVGDLSTTSSNASPHSLSWQDPELSSTARVSCQSLNLFYTPTMQLFHVTGHLLGFSVFREMEGQFKLIQ